MDFEIDPFYLYPVEEEFIAQLFIDREKEVELARTTLEPGFKRHREICAIVGGIGVGKSSFINMVHKIARNMNKKVFVTNDLEKVKSASDDIMRKNDILLIDDVDKASDEDAKKFYDLCESLLADDGTIFFTDTHERDTAVISRRNFVVSQFIILPRELPGDRLRFFLEERMKRCVIDKEKFVFPFTDESLEMASIRSAGNLRNFLNYAKNGWRFFKGENDKTVTKGNMMDGITIVDTSLLSGKDFIDYKILWYATIGDVNRSYLAHQCGIDSKTLDSRLIELSEFITKKRAGREINIRSIYKSLENGEDILENIFRNLGVRKEQL